MKRKMRPYEIILCLFVLAVIVAGLLMPKTGPLVAVDELCNAVVIWTVCIYVIVRMIRRKGSFSTAAKAVRGLVAAACLAIGIWFSRDIVLDLASGPETVSLADVHVSSSQGRSGVTSRHYYLTGTDHQGERIRLEISGEDYTRLDGAGSVTVEYYRHTGRVVRYEESKNQI